jgi:uncharacterized protein YfeS
MKDNWIKQNTKNSLDRLKLNGKIENVGEGNTDGALICSAMDYLKTNPDTTISDAITHGFFQWIKFGNL